MNIFYSPYTEKKHEGIKDDYSIKFEKKKKKT